MKRIHVSQSVRGALRNWTPRDWMDVKIDGQPPKRWQEARDAFLQLLSEGVESIPLSDDCVGHDPVKGCPGHQVQG